MAAFVLSRWGSLRFAPIICDLFFAILLSHTVNLMGTGSLPIILRFAACATRACIDIPIVNDTNDESRKTFITLERTPGLNTRIMLSSVGTLVTVFSDVGKSDLLWVYCIFVLSSLCSPSLVLL